MYCLAICKNSKTYYNFSRKGKVMKYKIVSAALVLSLMVSVGVVRIAAADDWTQVRIGSACPGFLPGEVTGVLGVSTGPVQITPPAPQPSPLPTPTPPSADPDDPIDPIHRPVPIDPTPVPTPVPTPAPPRCYGCGCCGVPGPTKYPGHYYCMDIMCPL
jgi:hypothetical protein